VNTIFSSGFPTVRICGRTTCRVWNKLVASCRSWPRNQRTNCTPFTRLQKKSPRARTSANPKAWRLLRRSGVQPCSLLILRRRNTVGIPRNRSLVSVTAVNHFHDSLGCTHGSDNHALASGRSRAPIPIPVRQPRRRQDGRQYCQDSFASFVHERILPYSLFIRLAQSRIASPLNFTQL